jgi:hypothetical protein
MVTHRGTTLDSFPLWGVPVLELPGRSHSRGSRRCRAEMQGASVTTKRMFQKAAACQIFSHEAKNEPCPE